MLLTWFYSILLSILFWKLGRENITFAFLEAVAQVKLLLVILAANKIN